MIDTNSVSLNPRDNWEVIPVRYCPGNFDHLESFTIERRTRRMVPATGEDQEFFEKLTLVFEKFVAGGSSVLCKVINRETVSLYKFHPN